MAADDGLTIGEWIGRAKNVKISAHAFSAFLASAAATYIATPELRDPVNHFIASHKYLSVAVVAATGIWSRYSTVHRNLTITTTVEPGDTAAASGVASVKEPNATESA